MKVKKIGDLAMALLMLALSAALYQQSTIIHPTVIYARGPVFFPRILIGIMALLSLVLLYQSVGVTGGVAEKAAGTGDKVAARRDWDTIILRWSVVGLALLYLLALPLAGYTAATIVFLFAAMCLLGARTPRRLALYGAVSVIVTFGQSYIFGTLLKLFLP